MMFSGEYSAALGGSPALSGAIIGMTPIAACVRCVLPLQLLWILHKDYTQYILFGILHVRLDNSCKLILVL